MSVFSKKFHVDFMISVISFQLVPIRIKNDDKDDSFSIGLSCNRQVGTLWVQSVPCFLKKYKFTSHQDSNGKNIHFHNENTLTNGLLHGLCQKTMISEIGEGWLLWNSYTVLNCPPVISYQHITNTCNRNMSLCTSPTWYLCPLYHLFVTFHLTVCLKMKHYASHMEDSVSHFTHVKIHLGDKLPGITFCSQ